MTKSIVIHANCQNPTAKGDFVFAANMAKDLVRELAERGITDIDIVLVSTLDGIARFTKIYGEPKDGRISVDGTSIGLSSLETFDAVENSVVAFIDANRCKHAPADIIKRILSPDSKFLFVGNVNQQAFSGLYTQSLYRIQASMEQPKLYDSFDPGDMLIGSAGLGEDRLGIPSISIAEDLPKLSSSEQAMIPEDKYGFMYLAAVDPSKDYKLIAQYMKLSNQEKQILVGEFTDKQVHIKSAYESDNTLVTSMPFPTVEYHQSVPNGVMRQMVAHSNTSLVLSTGVTSTLEVMRDKKLPYYQDMDNNTQFVAAYLIAVKSMIADDATLFGELPQMIIELSGLLFADKPLSKTDMERTDSLLKLSSVNSRLVGANQRILDKASGKIAPKLLGFLDETRKTKDSIQLAYVCASLRKPGETGSPLYEQALRRAASWGRLFELKVLIKAMPQDLDKVDPNLGRTALMWAVVSKSLDCARALIKSGASLDIQDKEGQTALHIAVQQADRKMIKLLIEAGASIDTLDHSNHRPKDCAPDNGVLLFIHDCHSHRSKQQSSKLMTV